MDAKIRKVIDILKIPKWFPDYDFFMIKLAFTESNHYATPDIEMRLPHTARLNYQTLEFYGDRALEMIIMDIFKDFNEVMILELTRIITEHLASSSPN